MSPRRNSARLDQAGLTLIELMVTVTVLGVVLVVVSTTFLSTTRLHERTTRQAEVQMASRSGMALLFAELRQAGADPANPPIGLTGIATATATSIRVRADLNGDGALQTAEPSEDVTYSYDAGQKAIMRNPGTTAAVVIPNVTAMAMSYFDANGTALSPLPLSVANMALVRTVEVTMTSVDKDSEPLTLTSRIALRNL